MTSPMTAITVRLADDDHKLLKLLCLATGKSQNRLITELIHVEVERVMPGKRQALDQPGGSTLDRLKTALGITPPKPDKSDRKWANDVINSLHDDEQASGAA